MNGRNSTIVISNSISGARLDAIKLLQQGYRRIEVCQQVGCSYDTLTSWLKKYLSGGLSELVNSITHQKPSRLSVEQQQQSHCHGADSTPNRLWD